MYMKIRLSSVPAEIPIPFDIFVSIGSKHIHYLRAGDKIEFQRIQRMDQKAPESFYILSTERKNYQDFIHGALVSDKLDTAAKATLLRESTMVLVEELFERPDIESALKDARQVVEDFVSFMDSDAEAMVNLIGLSSHDFYTYNHSIDVSIYSLGLGQIVGYRGDELKTLGLGGLFHDIGKRNIPIDVITKEGPLDDREWSLMQRHPEFGLIILSEHDIGDDIKACAFEHHESLQGNGYPQKLTANEIHPMARVVSVADTYDALTTKRSYSEPMTPIDALNLMTTKLAGRYDPEVLKALMHVFASLKSAA